MEEKFIRLTNSVYKVLEFFPESDPLKNRAKDKALAVMDNLVLINETSGWASFQKEKTKVNLLEDIDMLLGYLWIAKSQGWISSVNFLIISNGYEKIKKEISPIIELIPEPTTELKIIEENSEPKEHIEIQPKAHPISVLTNTEPKTPSFSISDRQKQILEFIDKNKTAQVMDLQTILPNITKRTIRRDLDELLLADKIIRVGEFNQVFYKVR